MIPASYFFKDTYRQNWVDATQAPPATTQQNRHGGGMLIPIAALLTAALRAIRGHAGRPYGHPAFD